MPGTNFPISLDDNTSLPNPGGTDGTNNTNALLKHSYQHDTVNAALKAIEAKLGTGASTPGTNGQIFYSNGAGSVWGNYPVGGDLQGTLPNPVLAASGVTAGTYGSSTKVPQITVDGKGRITAVNEITIIGGGGGGGSSPLTTKGDIYTFSTVNDRLPVGNNGQILSADSTQATGLKWIAAPNSAVWGAITGTLSSQTDLQTALNAKLTAASNLSDLASASSARTNLGLGSLATLSTINNGNWSGTALTVPNGGTGVGTLTAHGVLIGEGTGNISATSAGTAGYILISGGPSADPLWQQTLPVANGGTGANTLATGMVLIGNGTSTVGATKAAPSGNFVGDSDTQTLTNKTIDTAGPNVIKIAGTSLTAVTGSGSVVLATSPVITTGTVAADPTVNLGIASKQYVDNLGTTTLVQNETPGGAINGSNTAYTTASTFATGSLRVYLNGQRLVAGSNGYTEGTQAFTMAYAPATGDVLLVDYNVTNTHFIQGSNSIIVQETPSGTVNGTTTLFTVLQGKYVANTLEVYLNGVQQTKTTDYTETSPGSGTFTFTTAPVTGDAVRVGYQFSTGASGNADTVDGYHASDYVDTTGNLITDYWGWRKLQMTLTYVSATTFTVPGDQTLLFMTGSKLWLTQTTSKYFYVVGQSYNSGTGLTTVTITGGSDYSLANATITAPYVSFSAVAYGFPHWFNYTPTYTGFSSAPTNGIIRFCLVGRAVTVIFEPNPGTSNATTFTATLPITATSLANYIMDVGMKAEDNGNITTVFGLGEISGSSQTIITFYKDLTGTAWTASGLKNMRGQFIYEI